jgi:hypothetical protein
MFSLIYASRTLRRPACYRPASKNTLFERVLAAVLLVTDLQQRAVNDASMCDHLYLVKAMTLC